MTEYKLTITSEQARVLRNACELYTRVQMGQFWAVAEIFHDRGNYWELKEAAEKLKPLVFPDLPANAYHGICSDKTPEAAKISYDIQCVLRHRQSWDKLDAEADELDKRPFGVNYDTPLHTAKHPLPKINNEGFKCPCLDPFCKEG